MNSSKQIKWGAILSYISIAASILSGLLYTPWMVGIIGQSQYGLYTLAHTFINMFLVDFGLSAATSRYLSKYIAEGNQEKAEQFLGAVYKLYLLIDAVILVILAAIFFMMDRIFVNLTVAELEQFRVVYAITAIYSVLNFPFITFNGILTAYEKFVPMTIADLLYRLCNIGFAVLALLMGYGLYALVTIHAVLGLLILLLKYIVIRKTIPLKAKFTDTEKGIYKDIFGFSMWVTVTTLAARLVFPITPAILGIVADSAAIAVFGIVTTIEGYVYSITTAINGMFMPKISRIIAGAQVERELNRLVLSVGKFQYILNGLIITGFAVVGQSFIDLWMGADYALAYWGILLVLIPALFSNSLQIANTAMTVVNKVKQPALVSLLIGIVNVCLSFPLSKIFGVVGACGAIGIAHTLRAVLLHIIFHKELPLNIPRFIKSCYIRMLVPIVLTVAGGTLINRCIPDGGWMIFLLKAIITVVIYGLTTFFFALGKQEKQKILSWRRKER